MAGQGGPGQPQQYFSLPPEQIQQLIIPRPQSYVPARFSPRPAEQEGESVPLVRDGEQQACQVPVIQAVPEQPQALPHPRVIQQNYPPGPRYPTTIHASNPYQQHTRGYVQPSTGYPPYKPQGSAAPYTAPAPWFNSIPGAVYNQFASDNPLQTYPPRPMCSAPDIRTNLDSEDIQQTLEHDRKEKARQKMYKENKSNVRPHNIKEGDTILLERKTTKANSPYDPRPYTAEAVHGTQIVGKRGEERKVRDSQKWKKVDIRPVQRFSRTSQETREEDPDIGLPVTYQTGPGEARQQHQAEGAERGQPPADGEGVDRQRPVSRERWSFSPPRNWIERPSRPLTRSVAARRQRERVGHRKGAE